MGGRRGRVKKEKKKKSIGGARHGEKVQKKTFGKDAKHVSHLTGCRSPPLAAPPSLAGGPAGQRGPSTLREGGHRSVRCETKYGRACEHTRSHFKKKPVAAPGGRRDGSLWTLCGLFVHSEASHLTPAGQAAVIKLISFIKTRPLHNSLRRGGVWVEVICKKTSAGPHSHPKFCTCFIICAAREDCIRIFFQELIYILLGPVGPVFAAVGVGGGRRRWLLYTWLDDDGTAASPLPLSAVAPGAQPAFGVSLQDHHAGDHLPQQQVELLHVVVSQENLTTDKGESHSWTRHEERTTFQRERKRKLKCTNFRIGFRMRVTAV